ncbi:hypothetical protein CRENBAI_000216 [Crenichthys baileyi]|uniref:Uncharacterized protein n=1 Tax=Crenichthys baileyi TaxID=28760 RepID=A0AAV9QRP8_9TELE
MLQVKVAAGGCQFICMDSDRKTSGQRRAAKKLFLTRIDWNFCRKVLQNNTVTGAELAPGSWWVSSHCMHSKTKSVRLRPCEGKKGTKNQLQSKKTITGRLKFSRKYKMDSRRLV